MFATKGDRLVVRSRNLDGPARDGEILEVRHEDGSLPYPRRPSAASRSQPAGRRSMPEGNFVADLVAAHGRG